MNDKYTTKSSVISLRHPFKQIVYGIRAYAEKYGPYAYSLRKALDEGPLAQITRTKEWYDPTTREMRDVDEQMWYRVGKLEETPVPWLEQSGLEVEHVRESLENIIEDAKSHTVGITILGSGLIKATI